MKSVKLLVLCLLITTLSSCDFQLDNIEINGNDDIYFWLASDADTYVECFTLAGGCAGGDINNSTRDGLVVASTQSELKRSYINFPKPVFPEGTEIQEAYFEMFHSGQNEDGKGDNIDISVTRVRQPWNAGETTFNNQPLPVGPFGEFRLRLESRDWSGTEDISFAMNQDLDGVTVFEGFAVFFQSPEPGYNKGFYSNNHSSRTIGDLGLAPRLLLKLKLPEGKSVSDISFDGVHADGDGSRMLGYRFKSGSTWPADWDVAIAD